MLQYFPNITGSLQVTGSVSVSGSITATGGIIVSGSIASASYSSNSELLDNLDSTAFVFTSSFNTYSSSMSTRTTTLENASASLNTASGSFSTRVTRIEGNYATTGSNVFMGAQTVCANITSTGTIIAQTLNVQQVTSSIVYSSGSNTFGCLLTDRQQFTGSVLVTGSLVVTTTAPELTVGNTGVTLGNVLTDVHQVTGSLRITGSVIGIGNACITSVCSPAIVGGTVSGTTGTFTGQVCTPSSLVLGTNNAYALYLRDSTGTAKPVLATAGGTNLNIYNVCSTGTININNATDTGVILSLTNTGAATFSSTVTAAGQFTSTLGNNARIFYSGTATTGYQYMGIQNTCGYLLIGVEGSTTGQLATSDIAYSSGIYTVNSTPIHLGSNQVVAMTLVNGGNIGISCTCPGYKLDITALGYGIQHYGNSTNSLRTYAGSGYQIIESTNSSTINQFGYFSGGFFVQTGGADKMTINSSGIACFQNTVCAPLFRGAFASVAQCSFSATSAGTNYDVALPGNSRWLVSVSTNAVYHWNGILALTTFDSADYGVNILTCGSYQTAAAVSVVNSGGSLRFCFSQNVGTVTLNYISIAG